MNSPRVSNGAAHPVAPVPPPEQLALPLQALRELEPAPELDRAPTARVTESEWPSEEERILANVRVPPDISGSCLAAGIIDANEMTMLARAGFTAEQIQFIPGYKAAGITDYQKIRQYIELDVPATAASAIEHNELDIHGLGELLGVAVFFKQSPAYSGWAAHGFSPLEALAYAGAGYSPEQVMEFRGSYLSPSIVDVYLDNQLPYCPDTAITGRMIGPISLAGRGAYNQVLSGDYVSPGCAPQRRIVKLEPYDDRYCAASTSLGLRHIHPGFACHNIAAGKLNRLLGWHAAPDAKMVAMDFVTPGAPPELILGIAMEFVPGTSPIKQRARPLTDYPEYQGQRARPLPRNHHERVEAASFLHVDSIHQGRFSGVLEAQWTEAVDIDYHDPVLRRESIKSQLFDAIAGNADPSFGNKHLEAVQLDPTDPKRVVTRYEGIDYDFCFPTTIRDPEDLAYDKDHPIRKNFRGCRLPTVVDRDMVADLERLAANNLEQEFGPLLSRDPGAVEALRARLEAVLAHVHDPTRCTVIDPGDWGKPETGVHFRDAGTSYIARDIRGLTAYHQARGRLITYEQAIRG